MNKLSLSLPSPVNFLALSQHNLTDFCPFFGESLEDHLLIDIMCSKFTFSQITSTWLATVFQVNTPSLKHFRHACTLLNPVLQPVDSPYLPKSSPAQMSLFLEKVYIYSPSFLSLIVSCLQEGHLPRTGELYARDKRLYKYLKINILQLTLSAELKRKIS